MKTILPNHKVTDIEIGDKFLNTTWTVSGKWWREYDNSGHLRTYVPVKCDCGEEQRGRWDRLHTTSAEKAPWSTRCRKCSAGGKKRAMDTLWHNVEKSENDYTQNKVKDLSGKYIGDMFVIRRVGTDRFSHSKYECRCACGNVEIISDHNIQTKTILYCSKCAKNVSNGEKYIKNILDANHVKYIQQYVFKDLIGDEKALRFDFAIVNDKDEPQVLIEFQGQQHYRPIEFFGGEKRFEQQKRYDTKKREYCKENNITLIEIPYSMDSDEIKKVLLKII